MKQKLLATILVFAVFTMVLSGCQKEEQNPRVNENIEEYKTVILEDGKGLILTKYVTSDLAEKLRESKLTNTNTKVLEENNYAGTKGQGTRYQDDQEDSYYCDLYRFNTNADAVAYANYLNQEKNFSCLVAGNVLVALEGNYTTDRIESYKTNLIAFIKEKNTATPTPTSEISSETPNHVSLATNVIQTYYPGANVSVLADYRQWDEGGLSITETTFKEKDNKKEHKFIMRSTPDESQIFSVAIDGEIVLDNKDAMVEYLEKQ